MCSTLSEHLHTDTGVCGKGWGKEGGGRGKRREGGRKEGEMEKGRRWERQRNSRKTQNNPPLHYFVHASSSGSTDMHKITR